MNDDKITRDTNVDNAAENAVAGKKKVTALHADEEKTKKYVGIVILLATIIVVADKLGWYDFAPIVNAGGWRLAFAILLLLTGIGGIVQKEYERFFLPMAIVVIMYRPVLGLGEVSFWYILLVAVVLSIAFSMIFPTDRHGSLYTLYTFNGCDRDDIGGNIYDVRYDIILGGGVKHFATEKLRAAKLRCRLGDMNAFFTHAKSESTEVEVDIKLIAGRMTLYLPKSAVVVSNLVLKAGQVKGASEVANNSPDAVVYRLTGKVVWGTVEIKYV